MSGSIKVSLATKQDISFVAKMAKSTLLKLDFYNKDAKKKEIKKFGHGALEYALRNKNQLFLVAKSGKGVVGFIKGSLYGGVVYGDWIMVLPSVQRRGVGRMLYLDFEKRAKKLGAHKFWGLVEKDNMRSLGLARRLKIKKMTELKNFWYHLNYFLVAKEL